MIPTNTVDSDESDSFPLEWRERPESNDPPEARVLARLNAVAADDPIYPIANEHCNQGYGEPPRNRGARQIATGAIKCVQSIWDLQHQCAASESSRRDWNGWSFPIRLG